MDDFLVSGGWRTTTDGLQQCLWHGIGEQRIAYSFFYFLVTDDVPSGKRMTVMQRCQHAIGEQRIPFPLFFSEGREHRITFPLFFSDRQCLLLSHLLRPREPGSRLFFGDLVATKSGANPTMCHPSLSTATDQIFDLFLRHDERRCSEQRTSAIRSSAIFLWDGGIKAEEVETGWG